MQKGIIDMIPFGGGNQAKNTYSFTSLVLFCSGVDSSKLFLKFQEMQKGIIDMIPFGGSNQAKNPTCP
jgi:glycopeptide antibiotics resistance protein